MKSFNQHISNEDLNKKPAEPIDEASMGDLLIGLGAAGGLLALKKGWDTFGKGTKLQKKLHALNPFQTQKDKAAVAKDIEDKRKGDVEDAKTILDDPDASEKDKAKAQKTLDKKQTGDEKATAKVDAAKAKKDKKDTQADADALDVKSVGDAQKYFDKHGKAPDGYQEFPDKSKKVIATADVEKEKERIAKEKADKAAKAAADKEKKAKDPEKYKADKARDATDKGLYGKGGSKKKKDRKAAAARELERRAKTGESFTPDIFSDLTEEDRTQLLEELVLEETMTITESNELQAIMALDDAGIKAEINRKGQVVVKKKDLKKAEKALKKSFRKGGEPKLVGEQKERTPYEMVSEARKLWQEAVDEHAVRELYLFIENERSLQRQRDSIIKNIVRKMKSGKYDHKKAPKLWSYLVDNGAKEYDNLNSSPGVKTFDKETRWSVAIQMANEYRAEIELGHYK